MPFKKEGGGSGGGTTIINRGNPGEISINDQTTNYTIKSSDFGNAVRLTGTNARTFTLPASANNGSRVLLINDATAVLTIASGTGRTVEGNATLDVPAGETIEVIRVSSTAWTLTRDTEKGTGGGGGDVTTSQFNTEVSARESGDDLQSITVSSASSYQSALNSQRTSPNPLEIVVGANINGTRSGSPYSYNEGDVLYFAPNSDSPESRFRLPPPSNRQPLNTAGTPSIGSGIDYARGDHDHGIEASGGGDGNDYLGAAFRQDFVLSNYSFFGSGEGSVGWDGVNFIATIRLKEEDKRYGPFLVQYVDRNVRIVAGVVTLVVRINSVTRVSDGVYRLPVTRISGQNISSASPLNSTLTFSSAIASSQSATVNTERTQITREGLVDNAFWAAILSGDNIRVHFIRSPQEADTALQRSDNIATPRLIYADQPAIGTANGRNYNIQQGELFFVPIGSSNPIVIADLEKTNFTAIDTLAELNTLLTAHVQRNRAEFIYFTSTVTQTNPPPDVTYQEGTFAFLAPKLTTITSIFTVGDDSGSGVNMAGRSLELTPTGAQNRTITLPADYTVYDILLLTWGNAELTFDINDLEDNATKSYRSGGSVTVDWTRSARTLVLSGNAVSSATLLQVGRSELTNAQRVGLMNMSIAPSSLVDRTSTSISRSYVIHVANPDFLVAEENWYEIHIHGVTFDRTQWISGSGVQDIRFTIDTTNATTIATAINANDDMRVEIRFFSESSGGSSYASRVELVGFGGSISDGSVTTPKLADGSVTADKLADDALDSKQDVLTPQDWANLAGIEIDPATINVDNFERTFTLRYAQAAIQEVATQVWAAVNISGFTLARVRLDQSQSAEVTLDSTQAQTVSDNIGTEPTANINIRLYDAETGGNQVANIHLSLNVVHRPAADVQTLTSSAAIAWDIDDGDIADLTLGHNTTITLSNGHNGQTAILRVLQDSNGSRTLAFASATQLGGRTVRVASGANQRTIIGLHRIGTVWHYMGSVLDE